jgi:hypothetical protein
MYHKEHVLHVSSYPSTEEETKNLPFAIQGFFVQNDEAATLGGTVHEPATDAVRSLMRCESRYFRIT